MVPLEALRVLAGHVEVLGQLVDLAVSLGDERLALVLGEEHGRARRGAGRQRPRQIRRQAARSKADIAAQLAAAVRAALTARSTSRRGRRRATVAKLVAGRWARGRHRPGAARHEGAVEVEQVLAQGKPPCLRPMHRFSRFRALKLE